MPVVLNRSSPCNRAFGRGRRTIIKPLQRAKREEQEATAIDTLTAMVLNSNDCLYPVAPRDPEELSRHTPTDSRHRCTRNCHLGVGAVLPPPSPSCLQQTHSHRRSNNRRPPAVGSLFHSERDQRLHGPRHAQAPPALALF